jgi:hypothetical protein
MRGQHNWRRGDKRKRKTEEGRDKEQRKRKGERKVERKRIEGRE